MITQLVSSEDWKSVIGNVLNDVNLPTITSFISKVPVKMNKYLDYWIINGEGKKKKNPTPTPNPYYNEGIINHSRKYKIVTGFDYVKSVTRRRNDEGIEEVFEPKENWFDVISKGLVTDKSTHSKLYFRYQYQGDSTLDQEYLYRGDRIGRELFEQFEIERDTYYENQLVNDPCKFQVCNLNNILELTINGTKYIRG